MSKQYTDAQKAAYYKKKSSGTTGSRFRVSSKPTYSRKSTYKPAPKRTYTKKSTSSGLASGMLGTLGGLGAGALGLPPSLGSGLGSLLGSGISHFTGLGDYKVKKNAFIQDGMFNESPPIMNTNKHGGTVFRKTEYIGDVISGPAMSFNSQTYNVNPGLERCFLWLSQVAGNYEQYVIEGMYFEYRSMSADALNSTNTALGQVILSAQYNSGNPDFTNKQEMENYEGGVSIKPSSSCKFFLECSRKSNVLDNLYVRTSSVPTGEDIRMYDLCKFQIATNGLQGQNVNVGELWITYQIALIKPKLHNALGLYDYYFSAQTLTPATAADPLPTTGWTLNPESNLNIDDIIQPSNKIYLPLSSIKQRYNIKIIWTGSSTAALNTPTISPLPGGILQPEDDIAKGGTSTNLAQIFDVVTVPNIQNILTLLNMGTVLPSTGTYMSLTINQMPVV